MIIVSRLLIVCFVVLSVGCASNARIQNLSNNNFTGKTMQSGTVKSQKNSDMESAEAKTTEVDDIEVKMVEVPPYADTLVHNDANGNVENYRFINADELVLIDDSQEKSALSKTIRKTPSYMSLGYGSNKFSDECFSFHSSSMKKPDAGFYISISKCESPKGDSGGLYLEPAYGVWKTVYPNVNARLALGYYLMSYEAVDGTGFADTKDESGLNWVIGAEYTVRQFLIGAELRANDTLLMTLGKRFN